MNLQTDRRLTDLLKENRFTLSAEIVPPRNGAGPGVIVDQIRRLTAAGSQFLAVTKGAGGSLRGGSLPIAQIIKEQFQTPCIAHFTCRDLLPEEVESQLVDHHFFGIRNILALRGDPPVGVDWSPRPGSHPYAYKLVEQLRALNEGRYIDRAGFKTEVHEKTEFCIGVACYPDHGDAAEHLDFYRRKVDAGAEYAITQMLFDADSYSRFLDASAALGMKIPVLPGVRMVRTRAQAVRVGQRFGIPVAESYLRDLPEESPALGSDQALDAFLKLAEKFRAAGAPGIHLFVLSETEMAEAALTRLARS